MTFPRNERGQALVVTVLFMAVLLGMAAAVLDVGAWYRARRQLQTTADAAALAGAQALPESPGEAIGLAVDYAGRNGGGVTAADVAVTRGRVADDTIAVTARKPTPGIFTRLFGIDSVTVRATASARAAVPGKARWVAPVTVNEKHPMLACEPLPCFGEETEITLDNRHKPGSGDAAGAFGLLNLDRNLSGNEGAKRVGEWMQTGFDGYMELGKYDSVPSTEFNSSHFQGAVSNRMDDELLFPVYRPPITASGSNAVYNIIGWVGFHLTDARVTGNGGILYGYFTRVIWEGIESESASDPDFGVRTISLVE